VYGRDLTVTIERTAPFFLCTGEGLGMGSHYRQTYQNRRHDVSTLSPGQT